MSVGKAGIDYDFDDTAAYCWSVKGGLLDQGNLTLGPINMSIDTATASTGAVIHDDLAAINGGPIVAALAVGIRELPVIGSPCFCFEGSLKSYVSSPAGGMVMATATFVADNPAAAPLKYAQPWGVVLHPLGAETAANASTADVVDNGAATTNGGYVLLVVTDIAVDGAPAIFIEESADGTTYTPLTGASISPTSEGAWIAQVAPGTTIKQFTRWQFDPDGASAATFFMAFVRG